MRFAGTGGQKKCNWGKHVGEQCKDYISLLCRCHPVVKKHALPQSTVHWLSWQPHGWCPQEESTVSTYTFCWGRLLVSYVKSLDSPGSVGEGLFPSHTPLIFSPSFYLVSVARSHGAKHVFYNSKGRNYCKGFWEISIRVHVNSLF